VSRARITSRRAHWRAQYASWPGPSTHPVRFDAADLWRDDQQGVSVHADLWDSYLEGS